MSLINPKGIDRQHSLITKLREFFNSGVEESGSAEDERRDNQLKVYFEPHLLNFRKCAIFVSWDRKQVQRPSYGGANEASDVKRSHSNVGNISNHFSSLTAGEASANPVMEKKRFVTRGIPIDRERKFVPRGGYVKRA